MHGGGLELALVFLLAAVIAVPVFKRFGLGAVLGYLAAAPLAIVVRADSPLKDFADVAARAKKDPGSVTYATPGNGTLSHLVGVVLNKDSGVDLTHVPYKGAGPAITDLLGGQMLQSGKMRALAVTSPRRIGVFTNVPTLEELGYKNARFEDWYGVFAPAGTPADRVEYLNQAIVRTLRLPEVTKSINDGGNEVVASSSQAFSAQMREDIERWGRVVKLSGAKVD